MTKMMMQATVRDVTEDEKDVQVDRRNPEMKHVQLNVQLIPDAKEVQEVIPEAKEVQLNVPDRPSNVAGADVFEEQHHRLFIQ